MKFIQNLFIRNKLLLISLIPLIALLYFLITTIDSELSKRQNLESVHADVLEIEKITDAIYNIQEERGYSIKFVNSGGKIDRSELFDARLQTDKSITALNRLVSEQKKTRNFPMLDELTQLRDGINNLRVEVDSMALAMRTLGLQLAIAAGKFGMNEFAEFANNRGKFENSLERYQKSLAEELLNEYRKKMTNPAIVHTYALLDSMYKNPAVLSEMDIDNWLVNMDQLLSLMRVWLYR